MNKRINTKKQMDFITYFRSHIPLYIMMIPGTIALILFSYVPMYGIIMAFQDFNVFDGYLHSPFVGMQHFKTLFSDPYFFRLIKNTFLLGVLTFVFAFPAPVILAIVINECRMGKLKKVAQSVSYLPHFIPMVVMVGIMFEMFGTYGGVNGIMGIFGIKPVSFFSEPEWFRPLYIGSAVWKDIGWGSIIYMGVLSSIDPALYEAAEVDGASRWKRILYITLPAMKATIITLFILDVGGVMKVGFEKVFLMYSPATYEVADVLSTYVYRQLMEFSNFSYGAAVDLFNNVIAVIFVLGANWLSKKCGEEGIV